MIVPPRIVDANGDKVDDRLYLWYNEIARLLGRRPTITDTKRSYDRQRQYFLAGYGANPDKAEGAPHVQGRALDLRTSDSGMSGAEWKSIADRAARNIGLRDYRAIYHTGTAVHLHLEIGGDNPHLPDNCPTCTQGRETFAGAADDGTRRATLPADSLDTPDRTPPRGRTMRIASADPNFVPTMSYLRSPTRNDPFAAILGGARHVADPAARGRVKPGRRSFSENLPSQIEDPETGLIAPSNKASARYAALTGREGQPIGLGENRLATHGETRAAIFRRLIDAGGGDIALSDLKNIHQWGSLGTEYKKTIDGFIKEKGLDSTMVYKMLGQSERQLRRRDPSLFEGNNVPATLNSLFMRAQKVEETRLGVPDAPAPSTKKHKSPTRALFDDPAMTA